MQILMEEETQGLGVETASQHPGKASPGTCLPPLTPGSSALLTTFLPQPHEETKGLWQNSTFQGGQFCWARD